MHEAAELCQVHRNSVYETGEKVGKQLTLTIRQNNSYRAISYIKSAGQVYTEPESIMKAFQQFYQALYQEDILQDAQAVSRALAELDLTFPSDAGLNSSMRAEFEQEITLKEVQLALQELASGKAAGLDKLPLELYKVLGTTIIPFLLDLFRGVQYSGIPPDSWKNTNIIIFPKKDKPADNTSSYRPISLINSDSKLYSKILANRLRGVIVHLVSPWQHRFIPGKDTTNHTRRAISLFDVMAGTGGQMAMILLDAEKAFDRVSWAFLWGILKLNHFGPSFIRAIKALYCQPTARLQLMGRESDTITVSRGTRQGCPCSPILFALYINPLIIKFLQSNHILPISIDGHETKVMAYADDITIVQLILPWLSLKLRGLPSAMVNFQGMH